MTAEEKSIYKKLTIHQKIHYKKCVLLRKNDSRQESLVRMVKYSMAAKNFKIKK